MGKQINFYMNREDEKEFLNFVTDVYPVRIIIGRRQPGEKPLEVSSSEHIDELIKKTDDMIYIVNTDIADFNDIVIEYIKTCNDYVVEIMESFILEYSREVEKNSEINYGRIYIPTDTWKYNGLDSKKIKEMIRWYGQLERWIKKHYKKIPNDWRYIGPHTLEQYKQGKIKLISSGPGVFIRMDIGESGEIYNRIEDETNDKKYIDKI